MKRFFLIFIFFLSSCGYQPIYVEKDLKKFEFSKIIFEGNSDINKVLNNSISFSKNEFDDTLNSLLIKSTYLIQETSKNSKGQVESYRSQIIVNLVIKNKTKIVSNKLIQKNFSYPTKANKFELVRYQNEIKNNLIREIIQNINLFLNIQ